MNDLKVLFCVSLAVSSTAVFLLARNRPWEECFLKRAVVTASLVKFFGCVLVYVFLPSLIEHSDASNFYLPQTLELLSGKLPNKDFESSYSILFLPLLAIPVKVWPSAGSIILTMLVAETVMLILYLKRCWRCSWSGGWRVAFLYAWSPFSVYWVALSGHNGILIAFWMMLGLILAEKGRAATSGVAGAMAFLTSKLLGILAWPALAFYGKERWVRRITPMAISIALVGALAVFGMDFISPIRRELALSTTGNLWSILSKLLHLVDPTTVWPYLTTTAFTLLFVPMCIVFVRRNKDNHHFDRMVAFAAAVNLLFLALSKKAFSYYMVMSLIFVIHTIVAHKGRLVLNLLPLTYLGAVSRFEEIHRWDDNRFIFMEGLRIASYIYLLVVCFGISIRRAGASSVGIATTSKICSD
jgi:hypothetical protein